MKPEYTRYPPHPPDRRNVWFLIVFLAVILIGCVAAKLFS